MSKLRVHSFSISLDGAGPGQDLDNPLGVGGVALHEWVFATRKNGVNSYSNARIKGGRIYFRI